jgi:hypothetical protein
MDWGDAATWVGCGAAIAAAIYSAKSSRTAAESLRLQRIAAEPTVDWKLERSDPSQQWGLFFLRNTGSLDAEGVRVALPSELAGQVEGVAIPANAAHPLIIAYDMGDRQATHLMLTWRGQDEPVAVAIPPLER